MLTLCANSKLVPMGLLRLPEVAQSLGVLEAQVAQWCRSGAMKAEKHGGSWWVRVDDFTRFVEGSKWILVEPPIKRDPE